MIRLDFSATSIGFTSIDSVDNKIGILGFILGVIALMWADSLGNWVYLIWFAGFVCSVSGLFNYPRYISGLGLFVALVKLNSWLPIVIILRSIFGALLFFLTGNQLPAM